MTDCQRLIRLRSTVFGLLSMFAGLSCAEAEEFTFYGALTTDYVYRGISYSDGHGAVQLGLDVSTDSGFFGGIWASTIDITAEDRQRSLEVDYYIGYVKYFENDWNASMSINRYTFPGAEGGVNYNYNELAAVVGIRDRLWFEFNYTDSLFGHDEPAHNLEVLASWPLPASLSLSAGIGYFDVSEIAGNGYSYWQLGLSRLFRQITLDLRYHDTNNVPARISRTELADPRLVLTVSATF